jgi:hypothetical protein
VSAAISEATAALPPHVTEASGQISLLGLSGKLSLAGSAATRAGPAPR